MVRTLSIPDCNQTFWIHVDAFTIIVWDCLMQMDEKGNYKVITFISH